MEQRLKEFLQNNKELIMGGNFFDLYTRCDQHYKPLLTKALIDCGLDPLMYFKKRIPNYYARFLDLKEVLIPQHMVVIGKEAFYRCDQLQNVVFMNDSDLEKIEEGAFGCCLALRSIKLPNGLTEIGNWAFYNCYDLTEIYLPKTVVKIGSRCFGNGMKPYNDRIIHYDGTAQEFSNIEKGMCWNDKIEHLVVKCTDGDLVFKNDRSK